MPAQYIATRHEVWKALSLGPASTRAGKRHEWSGLFHDILQQYIADAKELPSTGNSDVTNSPRIPVSRRSVWALAATELWTAASERAKVLARALRLRTRKANQEVTARSALSRGGSAPLFPAPSELAPTDESTPMAQDADVQDPTSDIGVDNTLAESQGTNLNDDMPDEIGGNDAGPSTGTEPNVGLGIPTDVSQVARAPQSTNATAAHDVLETDARALVAASRIPTRDAGFCSLAEVVNWGLTEVGGEARFLPALTRIERQFQSELANVRNELADVKSGLKKELADVSANVSSILDAVSRIAPPQ